MTFLVAVTAILFISAAVVSVSHFYWGYIDCCEEKAGGTSGRNSELQGFFYDQGRRHALSRFERLEKLNGKISRGEDMEHMLTRAPFMDMQSVVDNECDLDELREVIKTWKARRTRLEKKLGIERQGSALAA